MMRSGLLGRYLLLAVSLFVNAFGIALITKASLGTSPISSVPLVISGICGLSFGMATFLLNLLFIIAEFFIIRRGELKGRLAEILLQLPVLAIFSASIDVSMKLLSGLSPGPYVMRLAVLVAGVFVLAAGIGWAIRADVGMNAGEYVVRCIAERLGRPFGNVKMVFDCSLVLLALLLSVIFLHRVEAVREGTVIAALLTGPVQKLLMPLWK